MSHSPIPTHNPFNAATNQVLHVAREVKSPMLEKLAIGTMVMTAVVSTGLGAVQVIRMVSHDKEKAEEKAYQRIRREKEAEDRSSRPEAAHPRGR